MAKGYMLVVPLKRNGKSTMSPEPSDMLAGKFVHRIFSIQDQESTTLKATMCPIGRPA